MAFRFNPTTGELDQVGYSSGGGSGFAYPIVSSYPLGAPEGTTVINSTTSEIAVYYSGEWQVLHTLMDFGPFILLETGDFLLQEDGFKLKVE